MKNYIQKGDVLDYVVPAETTIESGAVVVVGSLVGVAATKGIAAETIAVDLCGVFSVPKATGAGINQGTPVYWDATPGNATATDTDNTLMGHAWATAASGDTTMLVKLKG